MSHQPTVVATASSAARWANAARWLAAVGIAIVGAVVYHRATVISGWRLIPGDHVDARLAATLFEHWANVFRGRAVWHSPGFFFPEPRRDAGRIGGDEPYGAHARAVVPAVERHAVRALRASRPRRSTAKVMGRSAARALKRDVVPGREPHLKFRRLLLRMGTPCPSGIRRGDPRRPETKGRTDMGHARDLRWAWDFPPPEGCIRGRTLIVEGWLTAPEDTEISGASSRGT